MAIGILATYAYSQLFGQDQLKACQDERATLLRANASAQSFADSVRWSTVVLEKQNEIRRLKNELLYFREQEAITDAGRLNELETMRAINERYKQQAEQQAAEH